MATMDALAACAERVAATGSRNEKIAEVAAFLQTLDAQDLGRAVLYLAGSPFAASDPRKLSVGHSTLRSAIASVSGWDTEIIGTCYREVGDSGETAALLMRGHTAGESMPLAEAEATYLALHTARRTVDKVALLEACFRKYSQPALKFFVKGITGNLRIGLQEKMVEEAVAQATGVPGETIRAANNRAGDLARVAQSAREGTLEAIAAELFHPLDFMLARPLDKLEDLPDPENWIVEDKYDGIRSQLHAAGGKVKLFTRGLEETTLAFPEILLQFAATEIAQAGPLILDGEILGWRDNRALPFNVMQQRIARKKVTQAAMDQIPVIFLAYDILMYRGALILDAPVEERRRIIESIGLRHIAPQTRVTSIEEIDALFLAARARGNEGLLLKRLGTGYESGRRGGHWLKVKRPYATLDVVVTALEQGHGRRASVLSDVTFAVNAGERFVNIGKAYSGLTDEEIREMTRLVRGIALEKFGRVQLVKPHIVLEVAFDGVQKSTRHKGGYALRFPRIVRWRKDKQPQDVDTLARVRELYELSLA